MIALEDRYPLFPLPVAMSTAFCLPSCYDSLLHKLPWAWHFITTEKQLSALRIYFQIQGYKHYSYISFRELCYFNNYGYTIQIYNSRVNIPIPTSVLQICCLKCTWPLSGPDSLGQQHSLVDTLCSQHLTHPRSPFQLRIHFYRSTLWPCRDSLHRL